MLPHNVDCGDRIYVQEPSPDRDPKCERANGVFNHPEENCCACGKGIASLDTRLWDDCDPRWETIKRGCPGYRAWETASDYYRKQSSPARSLGPGNPCFNVSAATFCPSHAVA